MDPTPKPVVSMWLWITLIVVAVIGAGFFSWYYLMGPGKKTAASTATTSPSATSATTSATSGWLTYTNSAYGYSIQYPPTLTYTEQDGTKNVLFQTTAEKAASTDCATNHVDTECNTGNNINISVDTTAGTTNDETGKTLAEIVAMRERGLLSDAATTTLGGQPAYEGIQSGLMTSYDLFTTFNSHVYDLTINCDSGTFTVCKGTITSDQQTMIDSFTFL